MLKRSRCHMLRLAGHSLASQMPCWLASFLVPVQHASLAPWLHASVLKIRVGSSSRSLPHMCRVPHTDRQTDGRTDGRTDRQTDRHVHTHTLSHTHTRKKTKTKRSRMLSLYGLLAPYFCYQVDSWSENSLYSLTLTLTCVRRAPAARPRRIPDWAWVMSSM